MSTVKDFITRHYRHFNAAVVIDAAQAYVDHLAGGGKMLMTLAGAMSTAELGLSLADMIRAGKVDAICCTGANLEEDIFNLVAHDHYVRVPELPHAVRRRRGGAARAGPEPRDRHLHPRRGGDAPHRAPRAGAVEGGVGEGRALLSVRVHVPAHRQRHDRGVLPDRPEGLVDGRRLREEAADLRARLGGLDARQRLRRRRHPRRRAVRLREVGPGDDGLARRLVQGRTASSTRSASSRSAAASPATSRSASCR